MIQTRYGFYEVLDVNNVFRIKNIKFITGFKKMTKLVRDGH